MDSAVIARKLQWRERGLPGDSRPARAAEAGGECRLVCEECGRIEPYRDARLQRALRRVARRAALRSPVCDVTVHGLCERCSA
jgi:Fe2+ or Zn2+ uptake regulation protein